MQKYSNLLYIFLFVLCYEAAICSITSIPSGQKHKHKNLSQVVIGDLGQGGSNALLTVIWNRWR